jgi:hypothetical protein
MLTAVGHQYGGGTAFSDARTVVTADVAVVDCSGLYHEFGIRERRAGELSRALNGTENVKFTELLSRRLRDFQDYLECGKVLFLQVHTRYSEIHYQTGNYDEVFDGLYKPLLGEDITTDDREGSDFDLNRGIPGADDFWTATQQCLYHQAVLRDPPGRPLLFVKGTKLVAASVVDLSPGVVVLLPQIRDDIKTISAALEAFAVALVRRTLEESPPIWASAYLLPSEAERAQALQQAQLDYESATTRRDDATKSLAALQARKRLFTASGDDLRVQVAQAFRVVGFGVFDHDTGGRDIELLSPSGPAVVEVKGNGKSASQADARQLEQWRLDYASDHEDEVPKGILVVNTWRSLPPTDRIEASFPDQMLKFSADRRHCLITGIQLLGLVHEVEADPSKGPRVMEELFNTDGPFGRYTRYDEVLGVADWPTPREPT